MTLPETRVFADVVELRGGHLGLGWALLQSYWVLMGRGEGTQTRGKMPCEDAGRHGGGPAAGPGMPSIAGSHTNLGRGKEGSPPMAFGGSMVS